MCDVVDERMEDERAGVFDDEDGTPGNLWPCDSYTLAMISDFRN